MIRFNTFKKLGIFNFINEAESTDTLIKKEEENEFSKRKRVFYLGWETLL